ncbi:hypothetical protein [Streptomyces sp. NPDC007369]|uniref:hypothetical protein n=1 Tax=Streptomyces sp. NPDC007369 TaxID=3154589 RepID=UPI0033E7AAC5
MTTAARGAAVAALTPGYGRARLTVESRPEPEDGRLLTAGAHEELSARFEAGHVERDHVVAFADRLIAGAAEAEPFSDGSPGADELRADFENFRRNLA